MGKGPASLEQVDQGCRPVVVLQDCARHRRLVSEFIQEGGTKASRRLSSSRAEHLDSASAALDRDALAA